MGGHYGSVQVRSEDRERVKGIAEQIAREQGIRFLIGPALNGWIGIYPEDNGQDQSVGEDFAQRLAGYLLYLLVHDDDIFAYWLYRDGQLIDSFWNSPGYFGEANRAEEEKMVGDPEAFRPIIQEKVSKLSMLLSRDAGAQPAFASESLADFAKVLGISNAVTAYEYLKEGGRFGVKGWRQFVEVPPEAIVEEAKTKRNVRAALASERKRLKREGLLLLSDERKEAIPYGCALSDGFMIAWPDHRQGGVSFDEYREPWDKPNTLALDVPAHITGVASDGTGRRVAMAAGDRVRVWDVADGQWKQVVDIPEKDLAIGVAISPDGKRVAHASRKELAISDLPAGKRLLAVDQPQHAQPAFHPSGEWLAMAGRLLGLVLLDHQPHWRELRVGGIAKLSGVLAAIDPKIESIDIPAMEKMQRETMEAVLAQMRKMNERSGKARLSEGHLEETRRQMERGLADMKSQWLAVNEGRFPRMPPQPAEQPMCVGFSRDGRWLWCGTLVGVRVYEWSGVPRETDSDLLGPAWKFDLPDTEGSSFSTCVYAIAEEIDAPGIVFGGNNGRLYRMDLKTGETRELIKLPGDQWVIGLMFAADGKTLGVRTQSNPNANPRSNKGHRAAFEVWSYPRLRGVITV